MNTPKPNIPTVEVLGMAMPIMADLGNGWYLAAHPAEPAIATVGFITVLWAESEEAEIPESVRAAAVEAFARLAWPWVRKQFYDEAEAP